MTLQVEFWTVVSFLLTFMGFVGGLAKWLFSKTEERQAARFASLEQALQQSASNWGELEKEFMRFKADLPLNYVRREDYIRGQTACMYPPPGLVFCPNLWTACSVALPASG